jgi:hypothetical protein
MNAQRAASTGMPTRTQQCDIIACAYASHGDTKHVLFLKIRPQLFEFAAQAFDPPNGCNHHLPDARSRHRHELPAVARWAGTTPGNMTVAR